ncbi:MAG: Fic family protein [Armatimonadota bacterium]
MTDMWQPRYSLTNSIVNGLTRIESARVIVESTPISLAILAEMSRQAKIRSTHYSTRIEGNRMTLDETEQIITGMHRVFHGRERDVAEIRYYWNALSWVEELASKKKPVSEETIMRIHVMVMHGKRVRLSPYRTGQNVIHDSMSGGIVYMPPEAPDVPILMDQMLRWMKQPGTAEIPPVIVAGLVHYQFVTIHPYHDGNGRTARLLATYLLHRDGYGLKGVFSLEEFHSRDIEAYYNALDIGDHHNYYMGRRDADLTSWLEYFVQILSTAFESAKQEALKFAGAPITSEPDELRRLDYKARTVLALFMRQELITSSDVAQTLGLSERMARVYLANWVNAGWLQISDPSRRARKYSLTESMRAFLLVSR